MPPIISVIMPVYNGERFLREAIDSILNQTFSDFEFIIINDGSTDGTLEIIQSYTDERIRVVNNELNQGIVACLNHGTELARGEYIARMDADDISLPERFEKQVDYMNNHIDVGVLGGNVIEFDINSKKEKITSLPLGDLPIRWMMCFENPLRHPTIMMRKKLLVTVGGYKDFKASEDYDLWQRLSCFTKLANLKESILMYRYHGNNLSSLPNNMRASEQRNIKERAFISLARDSLRLNLERLRFDYYYQSVVIFRIYLKLLPQIRNVDDFHYIKKFTSLSLYKKFKLVSWKFPIKKFSLFLILFAVAPVITIKHTLFFLRRKINNIVIYSIKV